MGMIEAMALTGAVVVGAMILWRPQVGLLALVCFYPFNGWVPRFPVPGLNSETFLFGLGLMVTFMRFGFRIPPFLYSGPLLAYVAVLIMAFAIGSVEARDFYGAHWTRPWGLFKQVKALAFPCSFFVIAYFWFQDRHERRRLLNAVTIGVFVAALAGVAEFVVSFAGAPRAGRISSLFGNPNGLGAFLATFGLIPLYLMRGDVSSRWKFAYFVTYCVAQTAIIVTLSRGAWMATTVGHAVWFAYMNRQLLFLGAAVLTLSLTLAFPLLPGFIQDRFGETFEERQVVFQVAGGISGGGADRIVYYRIAADMFLESPVWGHGLESFYLLTPRYGAQYGLLRNKAPHSIIVKLSSEMGLIGLSVFFWIGLIVFLCARRVRRFSAEGPLGVLLLAASAAILTGDLVATNFISVHQISAFFWLLFAVAIRALETEAPADETETRSQRALHARSPYLRAESEPRRAPGVGRYVRG